MQSQPRWGLLFVISASWGFSSQQSLDQPVFVRSHLNGVVTTSFALHYIALYCIILHYITLHNITLYYIALCCITLHYNIICIVVGAAHLIQVKGIRVKHQQVNESFV